MEPSNDFKNLSNQTSFATLPNRLLVQGMPSEGSKYKVTPFDLYCPSMKDKLENGICNICDKYWPSEAAMKRHKNAHKKQMKIVEAESEKVSSESEASDVGEVLETRDESETKIPIFDNIFDLFKSPFVEVYFLDIFCITFCLSDTLSFVYCLTLILTKRK